MRTNTIQAEQAQLLAHALGLSPQSAARPAAGTQPAAVGFAKTDHFEAAPAHKAATHVGRFPLSADGTPMFRQGDPEWGNRILGHNTTIARAGCAMTATAMAMSKITGKLITPKQLDAYLDTHGGYAGDGLYWDKAAQMQGLHMGSPAWSLSTIDKQLAAGRPVVVGVDYHAGSAGGANGTDHYITLTGHKTVNGKDVYTANDPATGKGITLHRSGNQLVADSPAWNGNHYRTTGVLHTFSGGPAHPTGPGGGGGTTPPTPPTHPQPPPHTGGYKAPQQDLKVGSDGAAVEQLQRDLVHLGYLSQKDMNTGPGHFGAHTQAALAKFQEAHGIHGNHGDNYGPQTRAALEKALTAKPVSQPVTHPAGFTAPTQDLKVGDHSAAVEQLQKDLVHLGYLSQSDMNTGPGQFGAHTQAALGKLQEAWGIHGNHGENYGPQTRAVLEKALKGEKPHAPPPPPPPPHGGGGGTGPATNDQGLGKLSARYESNGNPGTVSGGVGDAGGVSYGTYQFASKTGSAQSFVNWLKGSHPNYYKELAGKTPGGAAFSAAWKRVAAQDSKGFGAAQHDYIKSKFYDVAKAQDNRIHGLDLDHRSKALKDVLWSTAVQHGPANTIFEKALAGKNVAKMSDAEIIKAVYAERGRKDSHGNLVHFSGCSSAVQRSVANRFVHEQAAALAELRAEHRS